jgi:hypothetical protein
MARDTEIPRLLLNYNKVARERLVCAIKLCEIEISTENDGFG